MTFGDDERAQSVLVGAILLFAILVIAFSSYQAFVVPNQNAEVEFDHNMEVQSDMQALRNSLLDVRSVQRVNEGEYTTVSEHRSARVRLGTQFPARLIALNPPAPSGTLETETSASEFRIENAEVNDAAIDGEFYEDPSKLLGEDPDVDLETSFLLYQPGYSEYQGPPTTVLEHSLLYNEFRDAEVPVRQQNVIQPRTNRLNIVLFEGEISQSGSQTITLDPETLDGPTASVPIEGDDITVQIPTRSPETWVKAIENLDGVDFETQPNPEDTEVRVVLSDEEYDLRVTRIGFDSDAETEGEELTPMQIERPDPEGVEVDPAYGVSWDTAVMDEEDEFECNEERCEIAIDDRGDTAIETDPTSVAGFAEFAVIDGEIGEFRDGYFEEFEDGTHRHEFEGLEIGETEIVVLAGDDRDELEIEVYGQGDLGGTVTDVDDDTAIEGATVTVEEAGASDTTDDDGEYEIADIRTGEYVVTAEADGYESDTSSVEIDHDETTIQDFALQPLAGFEVTITDTNSPVTEGETLEVDATIENMGDEEDTQDIELLDFDSTVVDTEEDLTLGAGDSEDIQLQWDTEEGDSGTGDITVRSEDDEDTEEVTIDALEPDLAEPELSNLDIAGQGTDATITEGESGDIEVDVENVGEEPGTFTIELEITNGETITDTETTEGLDPGETETVTFSDPLSGLGADEYDVTVADEDGISSVSGDLTVLEVGEFMVDIDEEASDLDVNLGEDFNVVVDIENTGETELEQNVIAEVDGIERDTAEEETLSGGEERQITLTFEAEADDDDEDVVVSSDDDTDSATLSVEEPTEPATVEVVAEESIGNNDVFDVSFDVENEDQSTVPVDISLDENPGGTLGEEWDEQEVVIDGQTFALTDEAAQDMAINLNPVDIFESENYDGADQGTLDDLREEITTGSTIENLDDTGSDADADVQIVARN